MLVAWGVTGRNTAHDIVVVSGEYDGSELFREMICHVSGGINSSEDKKVPLNPFADGEMADVDVPCAGRGDARIADGNSGIIVFVDKRSSTLRDAEVGRASCRERV